jgi:hypothetical protein
MILYVKSNLEPIYENWLWRAEGKLFSLWGIEKGENLFGENEVVSKKVKFKFIKNKEGLLIDLVEGQKTYTEYELYLGLLSQENLVAQFKLERFDNMSSILEHNCDYFVLRYSLVNIKLKYHPKGIYDKFIQPIFIGLVDVLTDSFTGICFKSNLSKSQKYRFFYGLYANENKRQKTLMPCFAQKNKTEYFEFPYAKSFDFTYFCVKVNVNSVFKNKKYKIKI